MPVRAHTCCAACLLVVLPLAFRTNGALAADPPPQASPPSDGDRKRDGSPRGDETAQGDVAHRVPVVADCVQPLLGAGYLPYGYPGFDTCPCGADGCFHPARYHCDCDCDCDCDCGAYKEHWLRTWLRAHFCDGSMLELYPCHCIRPQLGRGYLVRARPAAGEPAPPGDAGSGQKPGQDREQGPQQEAEPQGGWGPDPEETEGRSRRRPSSPLSQLPACRPVAQQAAFQAHR